MKFFSLILLVLCFAACKDDKPRNYKDPVKVVSNPSIRPIEILFNETEFQNDTLQILLNEVGLCDNPNKPEAVDNPPCSPRFFKVMPFTKKEKVHNAFVVLIKALVGNFPVRRLYVYQREDKRLICVNQFLANLIEFRDSPSGYDDLVMVFLEEYKGTDYRYTCVYKWNGKKYIYNSCEEIDHAKIKLASKDSMSVEVKKIIDRLGMAN
jgi:hypothetical protein